MPDQNKRTDEWVTTDPKIDTARLIHLIAHLRDEYPAFAEWLAAQPPLEAIYLTDHLPDRMTQVKAMLIDFGQKHLESPEPAADGLTGSVGYGRVRDYVKSNQR